MSLNKNKKNYIKIILMLSLSVACLFVIYRLAAYRTIQNDTIQINRIADEVSRHFDHPEAGDYSSYHYPFSVIDRDGKLLYSSGNPESKTLQDVMRYSDVALPILENDATVGTVIIETHKVHEQQQHEANKRYGLILLGLLLAALIALCLYDRYLYQSIIKPFHQIDDFAGRIAHGDFDATLHMEGNPVFQPLLQGLDLMREELRSSKQREYDANQSKKSLVASLSHDIKTPITSIKLAVELLQVKQQTVQMQPIAGSSISDMELSERLNAIMNKTEQIDHLVTDLFHTTMEDMEELTVTPREVYSRELVSLIKDADINHSVKQLSLPDCMIKTDPVRMGQVFTNIIYNSYKYAGTDMEISGVILSEYLILSIQDFGKGVDSEELPCIFNRFYRGSNTGNETGSGLGLYICKCLIDKMEGEIYCNNNERGFETQIKLPLA